MCASSVPQKSPLEFETKDLPGYVPSIGAIALSVGLLPSAVLRDLEDSQLRKICSDSSGEACRRLWQKIFQFQNQEVLQNSWGQ